MHPDQIIALLDPGSGYRRGSVKIESGGSDSAADLDALISTFEEDKTFGWIARQSGVETRPGPPCLEFGAILDAELSTGTSTLQIRHAGDGWRWTRLSETEGDAMLIDEVELATVNGQAALYRRYWSLPANGTVEVIACRLVSIHELGEHM